MLLQCIISSPHPSQATCDRKMHVYVCVIVWHKGSLTASNSLSSGSCCRAGAWWPIPPAPYFSFNDAQINSSTLFQNSFSPTHPSSSRHPHLYSSLPSGHRALYDSQFLLICLPSVHSLPVGCLSLYCSTWLRSNSLHILIPALQQIPASSLVTGSSGVISCLFSNLHLFFL